MINGFDYNRLKVKALRALDARIRRDLIEQHIKDEYKNTSVFFIDGLLDLVINPNDLEEVSLIITLLMRLTEDCDCHICCILHFNPTKDAEYQKMMGHLGSMFVRKVETQFKLNKNEDEKQYTIVSAGATRGKSFEDFEFFVSDISYDLAIPALKSINAFNPTSENAAGNPLTKKLTPMSTIVNNSTDIGGYEEEEDVMPF